MARQTQPVDHPVTAPRPPGPVRVALAEAHDAMRDTLHALLDHEPDVDVIAAAADLDTVLRATRPRPPDVLILSLSAAGLPGLAALSSLHARMPDIPIVMITMDPGLQAPSLRAGAAACVLKDTADVTLAPAVRRARQRARFPMA
jgi:DNA-binding NarL/FixJ family response regulator